jgi:3-dehydrosphinganine reductase
MSHNRRKDFYAGKKVLLTGGTSGIGLALARQLTARGASLWLVARNGKRLEETCAELKSAAVDPSQSIGYTVADVSSEDQARAAVGQAEAKWGQLDLVINDAGFTHVGYFQDLNSDVFRRLMDVNYFGTLNIVRAAVPAMIRRGEGHIVNVSSFAAIFAVFGYGAYAPTKYAVRGLSDILRAELKPLGIKVSLVLPPDTETPSLAEEKTMQPIEMKVINSINSTYKPEVVARDILRGVEKNRYMIFTGMDSKLLHWAANVTDPLQYPLIDLWVAYAVRKKKNILKEKS